MKVETALRRILNSEETDFVKMCRLWSLAAKQIPGSKAQSMVAEHWKLYHAKVYGKGGE